LRVLITLLFSFCGILTLQPVDKDGYSAYVRVFIALYDYDPYQSSPNDQPDIELPLSAGERLYVNGDIDEVRK